MKTGTVCQKPGDLEFIIKMKQTILTKYKFRRVVQIENIEILQCRNRMFIDNVAFNNFYLSIHNIYLSDHHNHNNNISVPWLPPNYYICKVRHESMKTQ